MLTPYELKGITIPNRIVMPAMCQYTATEDGLAVDWHLIHYGSRAVGGVGLIILEATAVEKRGRLSNHDLGVWDDDQIEGLREIANFCRARGSVVGIQIAHAGRKAWGEDLVAPSAIPFPKRAVPKALTIAEIRTVVENWRQGARRANKAGFDLLEVHAAHGYLIHEFLSPLSNRRTDEYGGTFEKRLHLLLEIVAAVQEEWPREKLLAVRLSAVDFLDGGLTLADTVKIGGRLKEAGVDLIDVSSGGLLPAEIELYPGYQVPYAAAVKKEVRIPTIAVGLITGAELVREIVANERADFVALGRELLRNPYWVLENSADVDDWPRQYERAAPERS
ncbi:MAG TPA: NADPH dehydrogenase NamA [Firmicutes bacterium]|nr:NADPH dehydrogenase NamA [Bacillota bacterium]